MTDKNAHSRFTLNPLAWLAASFALGIAMAEFRPGYGFLFISLLFAAPMAFAARASAKASILILIAFCGLGASSLLLAKASISSDRIKVIYDEGIVKSGEPVEIEGILTAPPEPAFEAVIITIDAAHLTHRGSNRKAEGKIRIFLPLDSEEAKADFERLHLEAGSRILSSCGFEREDRFLNPGVMRRVRLLDISGIDATCTLKSPLLIEKIGQETEVSPMGSIYRLRIGLIEKLRSRLSTSAAGMIAAAALGDKNFLDRETAEIFREGGTFHILVISGLHITLLGGIALYFVTFLTKRGWARFFACNVVLWAFTLAVGAELPAVRASVMFSIVTFAHLIHRPASILNSLGAAALLLLAIRPGDLFDPSFQLTFVSISAIVTTAFPLIARLRSIGNWSPSAETPFPPRVPKVMKRLCETLYWREREWEINTAKQVWSARLFKAPLFRKISDFGFRRPFAFIFEGVIVSAIVQLWLLPLLVVYFHRFTPASVLLNLWVGPMMAIETAAAFAGVVFTGISQAFAEPLLAFADFAAWLLLSVPSLFSEAGLTGTRIPIYSGFGFIVYPLSAVFAAAISIIVLRWDPFLLKPRRRLENNLGIVLIGLVSFSAALIIFHPGSSPARTGFLTVDFLDVGQGDAAFVTFPDGKTMLIDGGGQVKFTDNDEQPDFEPDLPRIGEAVVSEFLWEQGYSSIDYIVATHSDADHMQGLVDAARNFKIGEAWFGRIPSEAKEMTELAGVLKRRGVGFHKVYSGQSFEIGGAIVEVLNPAREDDEKVLDGNNDSVVLRISYGNRTFLFTGDIESDAEKRLLASGSSFRADVVKAAHHGSRTSSIQEFVDAVKPAYSIISVGRHSIFGHPHREVVERWEASGATVITTGETGTITISSNGESLEVNRYKP